MSEMTEFQDFTYKKDSKYFGHFRRQMIANVPIWLKQLPQNSEALFDECAHMGGPLFYNNGFVCKSHGWTYTELGNNLNSKSPGLRHVEIVQEDQNFIVFRLNKRTAFERGKLSSPLKISVLSHACLLLEYGKKRILFDPWLMGSAYYGSWFLEPDIGINPRELKVDAIVITHPHPDHFHLETLNLMDKNTPIHFPGFPSRIIENGLRTIGWRNVNSEAWDCEFKVAEDISLRFLQPRSLWEDSATLLRVEKGETFFTWLNLVDAGSVIDEYLIPELDLLSSAFDQGASGYPLTWTQITKKNQVLILEEQRNQTLLNLPSKSKQLHAKHFLPFAGHWKLGLNEHKSYADLIPHTSFSQLEKSFKQIAPDTKFLGLLPGDTFDFFSSATMICKEQKEFKEIDKHREPLTLEAEVTPGDVEAFVCFMKELIDFGQIYDVENVEFCVEIKETGYKEVFQFGQQSQDNIRIEVLIPARIFKMLANRTANWDHVSIGYWGTWRRTPNIYPANFMRLLQVGSPERYKSKIDIEVSATDRLFEKSIAELLEKNPKEVTQLLTRVGLPCGACNLTNTETLGQAVSMHRVDLSSRPWFIRELLAVSNYEASS